LHALTGARPIIRQIIIAPELPDFRNLGVILRVALSVNALAAAAALVREPQLDLWTAQWLAWTAAVEPHLIIELAVLYAVAPWLARQSRATGTLAIAALTLGVGFGVHELLAPRIPQPPQALLRHLLFALAVALSLLAYFRLRAKALSPAIAESRLQALQARIRPHFLFNSLNAVLSLIRSDPKQAETALQDMADLFRVLMRDNRELVPLADEIELCRQYLALEKLRLGDRLQVDWHLNSMPADAAVPPLLLQPLLENAVYHGIEPSSEPGVISINIFYKGGEVHAILRNPYRAEGGRHHAGNKMALANIRERLALHFDAEGVLQSKVREQAYEVHIRMPYRSPKPAASGAPEAAAAELHGRSHQPPPPRARADAVAVDPALAEGHPGTLRG
jgi:two-component system sensor histidine kinase AlgZ